MIQRGGNQERYEALLKSNRLLSTADLIKEMLVDAYKADSEIHVAEKITAIIDTCTATGSSYFLWHAISQGQFSLA